MIQRKTKFYSKISLALLCFIFALGCPNTRSSDDYYPDERDRRDSTLRGRNPSDGGIRTVNTHYTHYKRLKESHFDGEECDKNPDCRDLCEEISDRNDFENECGDLPEDMVTALHETFQQLTHITGANAFDRVDPSALGTLLHINANVMLDLLNGDSDDWTNRDVKEFLNWAASNPIVIEALREDPRNLFFQTALKQLNADMSLALLTSIQQYRDTFISQAVRTDNNRAVNLALSLIPNSTEGDFFCKRETISRSRASSTSTCHYDSSSDDARRAAARRSRYCYIHGPTVWSYINTLSIQMPAGLTSLNEDSCETYCEGHNRCEYN